MSWRIQYEEARPSLDRLTPVEAAGITQSLSDPYIAEGKSLPLDAVKTHAPGLYAMYQTLAMFDDAHQGRVHIKDNVPDIAWRRLGGFWQNIDTARKAEQGDVCEFADRFADAVRETFPTKGFQRS